MSRDIHEGEAVDLHRKHVVLSYGVITLASFPDYHFGVQSEYKGSSAIE